jgi:hypothetical protein
VATAYASTISRVAHALIRASQVPSSSDLQAPHRTRHLSIHPARQQTQSTSRALVAQGLACRCPTSLALVAHYSRTARLVGGQIHQDSTSVMTKNKLPRLSTRKTGSDLATIRSWTGTIYKRCTRMSYAKISTRHASAATVGAAPC